jgi:dienelactone hydrolase
MHQRLFALAVAAVTFSAVYVRTVEAAGENDVSRVLPPGQLPADSRLGKSKTLDDYFPFAVPASKEAWEARRKDVREQILVATGLWPMPEKAPVQATIHGKIDRENYTIEKVFFASHPGHYVSGNLYRPKGKTGKLPGVLCPHGHWQNGRFFDGLTDRGEAYVRDQLKRGAEKTIEGARFPLQARCAQLARLGCVVFHYDMVGEADSKQIRHSAGFTQADAQLRLQSFMGLQTFNSMRSLDFLTSLPDVDPARIGVTGSSGGGTQTFILCAVDDRPAVAFPAVMVSTAMQGGCICENCCYLRQGTGNVEFAGLFAPKPLGMTGADDWTKEIESKGLPELKALYRLYSAEDRVMGKAFPQFDHNYNQVSREVMYNWFNKHLKLGCPEPVVEKPFVPVPIKELSVYDLEHPTPKDAVGPGELRKYMSEASDKQIAALRPKDKTGLDEFRRIVGTALRVMIGDGLPEKTDVDARSVTKAELEGGVHVEKLLLSRKGQGEQIPTIVLRGTKTDGTVVVWIHPEGKSSLFKSGKLIVNAGEILDRGAVIVAPDVFFTGEFSGAAPRAIDFRYAGFTFGYNRPTLAKRVHDILTAIAHARSLSGMRKVHLAGIDAAGPWVILARALCGDAVSRTAADADLFRFENVRLSDDEMMLPGALKYGGLPAFAALCAPGELFVHNSRGCELDTWLKPAYDAAQASGRLVEDDTKEPYDAVTKWLLR